MQARTQPRAATTESVGATYAEIAAEPPAADGAVPDSEKQTTQVPRRTTEEGGAIPLLRAVYKERGFGGWYQGLTAQILKAALCQGERSVDEVCEVQSGLTVQESCLSVRISLKNGLGSSSPSSRLSASDCPWHECEPARSVDKRLDKIGPKPDAYMIDSGKVWVWDVLLAC